MISGGGRCNVTTGIFDVRKLVENYPRGGKFLMSAFYKFPPDAVIKWFEDHRIKMKIEDDLRAFPKSDNGEDVMRALNTAMGKTEIKLNSKVDKISKVNDKFIVELFDGKKFEFDKIVVTTGGNAYSHTGSTGDGYAFAKAFGHTITPLSPSLNSFIVNDVNVKGVGLLSIKNIAGVSFQKTGISLKSFDGKREFKRTGPVVFTHFGVSGPAVFAVSAMASREEYAETKPMKLTLDLMPDEKNLDEKILGLLDSHGAKTIVNLVDMLLPKSFSVYVVERSMLDKTLKSSKLSREMRQQIVKNIKALEFEVVGRGAGDEFVTAGGVELKEVNPNTMESKICPGLYFAGEVLDVDGFTGGFNLQASWAAGRLAAESIIAE